VATLHQATRHVPAHPAEPHYPELHAVLLSAWLRRAVEAPGSLNDVSAVTVLS